MKAKSPFTYNERESKYIKMEQYPADSDASSHMRNIVQEIKLATSEKAITTKYH